MTARDIVEPPRRQVQHAVEYREVEPRKLIGLKEPVELRGHFGRPDDGDPAIRPLPHEQRLIGDLRRKKPAHGHCHQRGGHSVAADIHDEQSSVLVVEGKDVEKVACKAVARNIPPCHMRGWERHMGSRKE